MTYDRIPFDEADPQDPWAEPRGSVIDTPYDTEDDSPDDDPCLNPDGEDDEDDD